MVRENVTARHCRRPVDEQSNAGVSDGGLTSDRADDTPFPRNMLRHFVMPLGNRADRARFL